MIKGHGVVIRITYGNQNSRSFHAAMQFPLTIIHQHIILFLRLISGIGYKKKTLFHFIYGLVTGVFTSLRLDLDHKSLPRTGNSQFGVKHNTSIKN